MKKIFYTVACVCGALALMSPAAFGQQSGGSVNLPADSQQSGGNVAVPSSQPQSGGSINTPTDKPQSGGNIGGEKERLYLQNPLSSKYSTVGGIIDGALVILSYVAVLAAVLLLIWTGLQFVLAQGEPKKIAELKTRLYYIVIGVALVIGARIIVAVVVNTLSATQLVTPETIQSANNALNGH